ncbi:Gfo/Idh/MocA family oxidoreductase [Haloechinothrix sp. LS1_15]|uniref:Gfo/Idh/MocA family protein n=1 Tax=Haloechinothrix sp. LS1_15 TaxID=2652248 RepID=UPI00294697A7|nr:Gfo/Idh/MocA family oxidoreductase [Haloechinothrix sp. LS1_15]MDV6011231.1 Gfo/Idh/MocA family oxidoreductase [Haloechinothrix sp. LS1_15]
MIAPDSLHIAVVGYGYWGSKHVRVLSSKPEVAVTVVETNELLLAEARATYPSVHGATSLVQVLSEVDAVVVATPPASHAAIALEALRAGKHVLVEKPLATSSHEAELLIRTAATNHVHLMVGHTFEYNAAVWKLKQLIDSGELGDVHYLHTARLGLGRYQSDCNVIWDLAPHDISIISYLLDETPHTVGVWAQRYIGQDHADVAYLRMDFSETNTQAFVHVSWLDPRRVRQVTVVGERKMAVYDDTSDERIRVYDVGVDVFPANRLNGPHAMPVSYRTGDIVSPYIPFTEPLSVQAGHFIECIRTGSRPNTPGERGLDVVRVLEATDRADGHHAVVGSPRQAGVHVAGLGGEVAV